MLRRVASAVAPLSTAWATVSHHAKRHAGVGIICAVAYFDPGNWSVDLQAGSQFGYKLLFMVLISGIGAVLLQVLACKLGCVTGLDLASHCRLLLNDHPKYPRLVRWVFLYPLYLLSELAIVSTDLAELLGSAIGICLIFPSLPLYAGVLLTATDVLFILAVGDPSKGHGRPVRTFEFVIIILVFVVFICFIVLIVKVDPNWPHVFSGYLPSKTLIEPSGLYTAIGIIGATVMPHALYLGSYMSTQDRISTRPTTLPVPTNANQHPSRLPHRTFSAKIRTLFYATRSARTGSGIDYRTPYGLRDNNQLSFIRAHLTHGVADIVLSLLGFAVAINSAILVLAGAVFFYGSSGQSGNTTPAGLFDAHDVIKTLIGKPAAFIFALALLCSGQSASITATLAGQIVSEGFIEWSVSPFLRRIITRLIGLVPAMAVAIAVGKPGINTLLVISQVVLSIVLPFVAFPLIWLTSSRVVMRVHKPHAIVQVDHVARADGLDGGCMDHGEVEVITTEKKLLEKHTDESGKVKTDLEQRVAETHNESAGVEELVEDMVDYSNGWVLMISSYAVWLIVLVANGYLIVTLAIA